MKWLLRKLAAKSYESVADLVVEHARLVEENTALETKLANAELDLDMALEDDDLEWHLDRAIALLSATSVPRSTAGARERSRHSRQRDFSASAATPTARIVTTSASTRAALTMNDLTSAPEAVRVESLERILAEYAPGSRAQPWTWDDEERDILQRVCCCCGEPGHYQLALEVLLREHGITQGVCLGSDGRVWDGHHRIVAARRLGIKNVPVEDE